MVSEINTKLLFTILVTLVGCSALFLLGDGSDDSDAAVVASGTCGTDLTWEYDDATKTLTISGSGTTMDVLTRTSGTETSYKTKTTNAVFDTPNLTTLKFGVFSGYTAMVTCEIPESVTNIEGNAFNNCSELRLNKLPDGLTYLGRSAFNGCSHLILSHLPSGLTTILSNTFFNCRGLALTELPESITSIDGQAFAGCYNLELTSLPENLKTIGDSAFKSTKCSFNKLPVSLTSIGGSAFSLNTELTSMVVPEGFSATIGSNTFDGCTNLKEILNLSDLDIVAGTDTYGKIAYYADTVSDHVESTAMVQQKDHIEHYEVPKDDPASKILTILPILVVIGILLVAVGLFHLRGSREDY